ncbi:hypothetical protein LUZ61_004224 [Rhynchospora tenuis]|uniref:Reverse transcriptase domain-containing protein n=1 Tax=Rhynchospora tenuis TaxID=198213 RepID=A0AAD5ZMC1_9POAL|nr:hypothetical protein LUZ61_004224 [Rhynchospora tenuis]
MSRLDRVLLSPSWVSLFPKITLEALPVVVSDHNPILLRCSQFAPQKKKNRIELFWMKHADFATIVSHSWAANVGPDQTPLSDPVGSFKQKSSGLHSILNSWSRATFRKPKLSLLNAKNVIASLDKLEETRPLSPIEFVLRIKLREKAYEISNLLEIRWHQRARTKWLQCGDRNTSYFHALASAKQRNKWISSVVIDGTVISDTSEIVQGFTSFFANLFGSDSTNSPFSCSTLYSEDPYLDLTSLGRPFSELEINRAVMKLANNKACGPDGYPNEFFKEHWMLVKQELLSIFEHLFNQSLDLQDLNLAHIVVLPKVEGAQLMSEFRPISILNYVPKLISKVLATRLQPFLPSLISSSQTGFIRGRMISENFIVAREMVNHLRSQNRPSVLLKLDFHKAFDSLDWNFLNKVLVQRGFPPSFISWINLLLSSSVSSVVLNGQVGPQYKHKRGVRQGDPISPFLFILAVDVLSRMLQGAATSVTPSLSSRFPSPFFLLQYADDTLIFSTAEGNALSTLKLVLLLFEKASGLKINAAKSVLVPFGLQQEEATQAAGNLGFVISELPLSYLGLPLTDTRPTRQCFQPILEKIQRRLAGWKAKLLSRAGRVTLASSVLSAVPSYFMSSFLLLAWLIKEIDKLRRKFIWGTNQQGRNRLHLMAWQRLCQPKSVGGLGLVDLKLQNQALLLRWIWNLYTKQESLWGCAATNLYCHTDTQASPLTWKISGSFFWRDLRSLFPLFQLSTRMTIQSGRSTSFWFDNWAGQPLCLLSAIHQNRPINSRISFALAFQRLPQLLPRPFDNRTHLIIASGLEVALTSGNDSVYWYWSSSGKFSVSSFYNSFALAGKTCSPCCFIWNCKSPPSIKLFLYFLFHDRLLTRDQLRRRNVVTPPFCVLCSLQQVETSLHLFFHCPFVAAVWSSLQLTSLSNIASSFVSTQEGLLHAMIALQATRFQHTLLATSLWGIWLERNQRIFRNSSRPTSVLVDWISSEAGAFFRCC